MDIQVKFVGNNLSDADQKAVWDILVDCDNDFYPPLSSRESSHQSVLLHQDASPLPDGSTAQPPNCSTAQLPNCPIAQLPNRPTAQLLNRPTAQLLNCSIAQSPRKYFDEMIRQDFILAYADGILAGFLTFRQNYTCEALSSIGPSLYITTICVAPSKRKLGVMSALYDCLESEVAHALSATAITTRTWSLNAAQLHTLSKRGYTLVTRIPDDRGPGVDTVYYLLKRR